MTRKQATILFVINSQLDSAAISVATLCNAGDTDAKTRRLTNQARRQIAEVKDTMEEIRFHMLRENQDELPFTT